jgi:predicted DNA-binding transcriptional regulator YafY
VPILGTFRNKVFGWVGSTVTRAICCAAKTITYKTVCVPELGTYEQYGRGVKNLRYEKTDNMLQLALEMQARRGGMSLVDIEQQFDVKRRTAMRMRDAIIRNFPQAEEVESGERTKRWRIPPGVVNSLVNFTADELADLNSAIKLLRKQNRKDQAANLEALETKLRSLLKPETARRVEPDIEALMEAEGIAARPGPRPRIKITVVDELRRAIKRCNKVEIQYRRRKDGKVNKRLLSPYGFLHGHRHYLVAWHEHKKQSMFLTFALPSIESVKVLDEMYERDPEFSLDEYASRSFGLFQEEPFDVVWKFTPEAAPTAREFIFHPNQSLEEQPDGSLIVNFRTGSNIEMAWHLFSWGDQVEVIKPKELNRILNKHQVSWGVLP